MPNMLNQIADIKQLSDYELKLLGSIAQEKAKQKGAQIKQSIDDKLNKAGKVGKDLYYLTLGSTDPNNPYAQQQAQTQPQPAQQPQVQTPPVQATTPPSAQIVQPRPVQRPVARPQQRVAQPAPVQQPQQQANSNMITDLVNMYMLSNGKMPEENSIVSDEVGENVVKQSGIGQYGLGNIDLYSRPKVKLDDGTTATVRSMSFNDGNNEVLIPTVSDDGRIMSEEEAIQNYLKTGKYLGKFDSIEEANKYAEELHNEQERLYSDNNKSNTVADILNQIKTGYSDNRDNGFALENLQADPTKTGWNRFGEALGTATRMTGNPLVQGLVAGAISGKVNNDWGKGLEYGLQYAQNKAKSDAYEKMMGRRPSILGGYGTDDYKANVEAQYKQNKIDLENKEYGLKEYKTGYEVENLKSQIAHRAEQDKIGWARVQAQVSNASARLAETKTHNRIMEAIQQSRILNSNAKTMLSVEDKVYKANRNAILNNKQLNNDQRALALYDLDNEYANNLQTKYGINYKAMAQAELNSGTQPQATKNTQSQTKSTEKGWAF